MNYLLDTNASYFTLSQKARKDGAPGTRDRAPALLFIRAAY
jgi:hypothetical protein